MFLKLSVLLASIAQVLGAAYLSIGTFEQAERALPVLIQPASWAFSIWGLIYLLSFVYAVYQIIPKYDNEILHKTRVPALIGFLSSIAWLYFAGTSGWLTWLTIPILFAMAIVFIAVVTAPETDDTWQTRLSKYILLPYAAWTGIACWINTPALLLDRGIVTSSTLNTVINLGLLAGIVAFTSYYFKKSGYSAWYGGVMVWAAIAVAVVNFERGDWLFVIIPALFALWSAWKLMNSRTW
ncbi:hypothetical protein N9L26_01135 [Candidatus Pacebacteria bacterium]|nr:hypothetical protein [Candidatus Paceibacterota bacterium]